MFHVRLFSILVSVLVMLEGCNPALPRPPLAPQPDDAETLVVQFPPPPARGDVIRDPPEAAKDPRWIDGQWLWRGARWIWEPGAWVDLEPDQVYSLPYVVRRSDGALVWYQGKLRKLGPPPRTEATSKESSNTP